MPPLLYHERDIINKKMAESLLYMPIAKVPQMWYNLYTEIVRKPQ